MQINKSELFALVISLSATITLTFFLIESPYQCIVPFEPNPWIRIPEIIMGIAATFILIRILWLRVMS